MLPSSDSSSERSSKGSGFSAVDFVLALPSALPAALPLALPSALPAVLPAALLDDFFGAEDWARRVFGASFASFAAFDFVVDRRLRLLEDMVIGCVVPLDNGGCRRCNGKSYCSVVVDLVVEGNGTAVAVV